MHDDVIDDGGSFLRPSPSEEDALGRFLDDRGIDGARPWVCFVVRDARFAPVGSGPHASGPLRSRSFEDFIPAALALADRGIPVFKIGLPGTLDVAGLHSRLFDYANDPAKDPILDVMLPARATTVVSTMSGPDAVALAAQVSAAETRPSIQERAQRVNWRRVDEILAKVPAKPPLPGDE